MITVGCLLFRFLQPQVEGALAELLGEAAPLAAIILIVLGILILQQGIAWVVKKLRSAMLLTWPDRLMGFVLGGFVSFFFLAVVALNLAASSAQFGDILRASRSWPAIEMMSPLVSKVLAPHTLEEGKNRLFKLIEK